MPPVESNWNVMAHGDTREGKWRENRRMELVVSTLHTTSEHGAPSITTADAHNSAASSRLNWRTPADLNGPVRFAETRNLVSARAPSHFKRGLTTRGKVAGAWRWPPNPPTRAEDKERVELYSLYPSVLSWQVTGQGWRIYCARPKWHAAFTAVPISLYFFCPTIVSILWIIYIYIYRV
jgi:hypothetical protein